MDEANAVPMTYTTSVSSQSQRASLSDAAGHTFENVFVTAVNSLPEASNGGSIFEIQEERSAGGFQPFSTTSASEQQPYEGARRRTSFLGSKIGADGGIVRRSTRTGSMLQRRRTVEDLHDLLQQEDAPLTSGDENRSGSIAGTDETRTASVGSADGLELGGGASVAIPSLFTAPVPVIDMGNAQLSSTLFPGGITVKQMIDMTLELEPPNIICKITPDLRSFLRSPEATTITNGYFWSAVVQERRRRSENNMLRVYRQLEESFVAMLPKQQAHQQNFSIEAVEKIVFGPVGAASFFRETSIIVLPGQQLPISNMAAKREFFAELLDEFYTYLSDVNDCVKKEEDLFAVLADNFGKAFKSKLDTQPVQRKVQVGGSVQKKKKVKSSSSAQDPLHQKEAGQADKCGEDHHLDATVEGGLVSAIDAQATEHDAGNKGAIEDVGGSGAGNHDAKDSIFSVLPTVVVHTVYYALVKSFPNEHNAHVFSHRFRRNLFREFVFWSSGVSLQHVATRHWPRPPEERSVVMDVIAERGNNVANGQFTAIKEFKRQLQQSRSMFSEWLKKQEEEMAAGDGGGMGSPSSGLPPIQGNVSMAIASPVAAASSPHEKRARDRAAALLSGSSSPTKLDVGPLPTLQAKQWFEQGNARGCLTMERKFEFGFSGVTVGVRESKESRNDMIVRVGGSIAKIPHAVEDCEGGYTAPSIPRKVAISQNTPFLAYYAARVLRFELTISDTSKAPPVVMLTALSNNDKFSRRLNFKGLAQLSHQKALEAIAETEHLVAAQKYEDRKNEVDAQQLARELESKTQYAMQMYDRMQSARNPEHVFRVVAMRDQLSSAIKDLSKKVVRGAGYELYANALTVMSTAEEMMISVPGAKEALRGQIIALGKKLRYYERMCTDPLHQERLLNESNARNRQPDEAERPATSEADMRRREHEVNYGAQLIFEREYGIMRDGIMIAEDEEFRSIRSVFQLWYATMRFGAKGEVPPQPRLMRMQSGDLFLSAEDQVMHAKYKKRVHNQRQEAEEQFETKLTNALASYDQLFRNKFLGAILATTVGIDKTWPQISKHRVFESIMDKKREQERIKEAQQDKQDEDAEDERSAGRDPRRLKQQEMFSPDEQLRRMDNLTRRKERPTREKRAVSPNTSLGVSKQRKGYSRSSAHQATGGAQEPSEALEGGGTNLPGDATLAVETPMSVADIRALLRTPGSSMSKRKSTKNLLNLAGGGGNVNTTRTSRSPGQTGFVGANARKQSPSMKPTVAQPEDATHQFISPITGEFNSLSFASFAVEKSVFPVKPGPKHKIPLATSTSDKSAKKALM